MPENKEKDAEIEKNCIFCKIVSKKEPSHIVYEDDKFLGFLDINPVAKGHVLLIPKEHHIWMHETPDDVLSEAFIISKKLINIMRNNLKCSYVQVTVSGTEIPHLHIHLIPKNLNSETVLPTKIQYDTDTERDEFAQKLKNTH